MNFSLNKTVGVSASVIICALVILTTQYAAADDYDRNDLVDIGFRIAPVPLNLVHKDREMVGLGSYLVNSVGDCNGCHTSAPATEYAPGGNPYFGQPAKVNQATYLGGGQNFGALIPGSYQVISRNLTPDRTGLPEGGHTLDQFLKIMHTGVDMDHLHPTCPGKPNTGCIPPPFDGSLLQVMPWPAYRHMTDHELEAIYVYLSAIPCVAGPSAPSPLHNDCH